MTSNKDVAKRFVEASIIGWYNYLYGDNAAANELIKNDNPDMTDEQIAFGIAKMKELGHRRLRRRRSQRHRLHDRRPLAVVLRPDEGRRPVPRGHRRHAGLYRRTYVCQGLGKDLVK